MTDRELMQQALEDLKIAEVDGNCNYRATELLRNRLAQPEQPAKIDIDYWVSSRTQIVDVLAKAGFTLMSNADGFWLQPAPQPEQSVAGYCKKIEELIAERDELRDRLAQPEQDVPEASCGNMEPCIAEQWDAIPDAFNDWWDADYDDTGNPYSKDSPAYWAWSGWKAASKQPEQEPVAKVELMLTGGAAGLATRIVEIDDHLRERLRPGQLLYTTPPQRKPLAGDELADLWYKQSLDWMEFARAIEAAHGIGEKPDAA